MYWIAPRVSSAIRPAGQGQSPGGSARLARCRPPPFRQWIATPPRRRAPGATRRGRWRDKAICPTVDSSAVALILIADDLATAREVAARGLREQGHRVTTASDGQEALLQFARERPDLAIVDLFLPRVSGLDACARIKAAGAPFTPVIMTGISSELGDRVSALAVA